MKSVRARVEKDECTQCRDALISDCRASGLPMPVTETIVVPYEWLLHQCPHVTNGLVLRFREEYSNEVSDESNSCVWGNAVVRDGIDAAKNIGFPVREGGKYGTHPSHDGFSDESEP
jgi:hypothetical protein